MNEGVAAEKANGADVVGVWGRSLGLACLLILTGLWLGEHGFPHGPTWATGNFFRRASYWDGGWYLSVAEHGYHWNGNPHIQQNVAFFPLYPLIERLFHGFGLSWGAAAIVPSLVCAAVLPPPFYALAGQVDKGAPRRFATMALMIYPGAQFYIGGYPTSLMNLIVILALWGTLSRRYWIAAAIAGIGTAVGPLMVFLSATVWGAYVSHRVQQGLDGRLAAFVGRTVALGILALSGLLLYMAFLWLRFRDPLAFMQVQHAWGSVPFGVRVYRFFTLAGVFGGGYTKFLLSLLPLGAAQPLRVFEGSLENTLNTVTFVILAASVWWARKTLPRVTVLYATLALVGYLWFMGSVQGPMSTVRLLFITIPAFMAMGQLAEKHRRTAVGLTAFFGGALVLQTALFAAGYWVV